ncbi:MAG: hypothetical protein P8Y77_10395, partial [Nitrospirota bacterium]
LQGIKVKRGKTLEIPYYRPVTPEVAGSSPVHPAISLSDISAGILRGKELRAALEGRTSQEAGPLTYSFGSSFFSSAPSAAGSGFSSFTQEP